MQTNESSYAETSVPAGALLIALGVGIWALHGLVGVFTGWGWAAAVGSLWVVLGALLLFSNVRVYQFGRSPLEQLLLDGEEQ
ncbi:hypothetical protein [Halobellus ordinarius]|uniref:hypothetical protein n=1 Tax=Halobellus ordinarius TaxID=3075120 RepID=UPI0028801007|nr:hypothetical protein [Halobellus sp. ZY16]